MNSNGNLTNIGKKILFIGGGGVILLVLYIVFILPSVSILTEQDYQVPLRIFTEDGELIAEFGEKHRFPVKYKNIPEDMVHAIIAIEDKRFYSHYGVDFIGLARAFKELLVTGKKSQGASTITMQVARNFFLSPEKTFSRKINEILLSFKIEFFLNKNEIIELYLNKIFLGHRAYGIKAAARNYYGKELSSLSLPQFAMLAGLPKAPSSNNPIANPEKALARRNLVLRNMLELKYISETQYNQAIKAPLTEKIYGSKVKVFAPYIAEMIRKDLFDVLGKDVYLKGFNVYTTVNSTLQNSATKSLVNGLLAYDKRHGLRSATIKLPEDRSLWGKELKQISVIKDHVPAGVINIESDSLVVSLSDDVEIQLSKDQLEWALYNNEYGYRNKIPFDLRDILNIGDVVFLAQKDGQYVLTQNPSVEGAVVSMDPNTGAILALNGGYHFFDSKFNRATQAKRQLGSLFKPFVFSAALENEFNLASIVNDAPVVIKDSGDNEFWRPHNVNLKFNGPTNLRVALAKSRNLVAVRLLDSIGVKNARDYITRFGFDGELEMPSSLSLALGSGQTSPLKATVAYSVFASGGLKPKPYLIEKIIDQNGSEVAIPGSKYSRSYDAPRVINETNAYLINDVLQDVIKKGTGRRALSLKNDYLAGKTGTTNNQIDAWFSGYSKDLVTTVWVGFDNSKSVREYAAQVALPIWVDYMRQALILKPSSDYSQPDGIVTARVNQDSGLLSSNEDEKSKFEIFDINHLPAKEPKFVLSKKQNIKDISDIFD
jgi:penicillin-binding protein 1A